MDDFFSCYLWWVILGIFLGFLAFWLFDKCFKRDGKNEPQAIVRPTPPSVVAQQPLAAVTTPVQEVKKTEKPKAEKPKTVKAKAAKPKVAKPKAVKAKAAKPKAAKPKAASVKDNASEFGFKPTKKGQDNLTLIEGVGPKISQILISKDLGTFEKLSKSKEEHIKEILDGSGSAYKMAKPQTWPKQAKLAHSKKWKELKALQDRLVGGVEPEDK